MKSNEIITVGFPNLPIFPITPHHIDVTEGNDTGWFGVMPKHEYNWYAWKLCQFAQKRGNWAPFTQAEFDEFCGESTPMKNTAFLRYTFTDCEFSYCGHRNDKRLPLIVRDGNKFYFTKRFVTRCFFCYPAV